MANLREQILRSITPLLKKHAQSYKPSDKVTVGWPAYDEKEVLSALGALLDLQISQGPRVRQFEAMGAAYVGVPHAVAVNSGSSANLLALSALMAMGKASPGDEVIVPACTFSTVASPVIQVGLIPVYVDVDPLTWNLDPKEVERAITKKTKAMMAVHMLGNPAPMPKLMAIAKKHKLTVIEDCCEAHGARIGKRIVGSFGDIATLSFFVAHNITTGEGGMIFTRSKEVWEMLKSLREFGRLPPDQIKDRIYRDPVLGDYDSRYIFTRIGYNLRMTDICAALGVVQLRKLDALNKKRLKIVAAYNKALKKYQKFLQLPVVHPGTMHTYYGYGFAIKPNAPFKRSELTGFLEDHGVETRAVFAGCLPDQPGFRNEPGRTVGKLPVSRWIRDCGVFIGCHPALTKVHVKKVERAFEGFFAENHV